ncbi:MAG: hypothetical protein AVDCRST_MAG35-3150 [uncultured Quadrisphaera sp.]|uniref:DUF8129 domain-containing protein n=1 Tax=uncultured Quadrisphaera sp. TaxID=904978 RepID=A0A6J4QBI9_9ACTN|nr:MAG: hypothetical protein AVDCRST_MAG35-3150 [uncultured Quadrisphaera sp.]
MTTSDLPIPDYDHLALGDLTGRVRSLDRAQLEVLIGFEEQHGARAPVLQVMRARRDQLDAGAQPSSGDPTPPGTPSSVAPSSASGDSKVGTATTGPPVNPPSHGTPTNPAQPR